jgi:hypothetical protein
MRDPSAPQPDGIHNTAWRDAELAVAGRHGCGATTRVSGLDGTGS